MCRVLGLTRAGYYAWKKRPSTTARRDETERMVKEIREVHRASRGTYGSPRIHAELGCRGVAVSRGRVERLMRKNAIAARIRRRFRATTDSDHDSPVAANILDRRFEASRPNQSWSTDITYIWTQEGWLYLAVVLDLFSRRIVGWSMAETMATDLVVDALTMALGNRLPDGDLLHHSDRGGQYASFRYQKMLEVHGIRCSMSRRGECYDNAVVESFFGTLKNELVHRTTWATRDDARLAVHEYIEVFYNRRRRHSRLGYKSPAEFEAAAGAAGAA